MENNNFEQFIKQAKKINLSPEERSSIEKSVLNFMKENPVRPDTHQRLVYQNNAYASFWSNMFQTKLNYVSSMAILLLISILVSGGAALGAEKSLPGDMLYPVKVSVNEQVQGWFKVSEEAKADWEVQRAQRRLEEAEQLAADGSLDAEARAQIEANFESHAERVRERIAKFESKENFNGAAEVSSNFETSLNAHQKILAKLSETETDAKVKGEINPIAVKVRSRVVSATKSRSENETKASAKVRTGDQAAAEARLKAAEHEFSQATEIFESVESNLVDEAKLQSEIRLDAARVTIDYGKSKLEAKAYGEAFIAFQKSIRILREARLLVQARNSLNVDVGISNNVGGDVNGETDAETEINGDLNLKTDGGSVEGKLRLKANLGL